MTAVAHVMAGARGGGAELFFERLCIALHESGEAVTPVIRRDAGRAGRLRAGGLRPCQLGFGGFFDLLTTRRLRRVLREAGPRVVVAWMNRAARFTPAGNWLLAGRLGGYYDLNYYRRCDVLIGNTRGLVQWMVDQGWPASRVHYLPNFVPDLAGAAPDRCGVAPGRRLIATAGRLHRNKAFDVLIRSVARLPDVALVIAGDGPERPALRDLVRGLGLADRVHLPGWLSATASLLAACDVFVCPSRHEPLGNVVLEAWSAGKPLVSAAAQGPRELLIPGEDGLLVPVEDDVALASSIGAVLENAALAARLAQAGRARWAGEFAEAPVVARWREFLAEVGPG
jgi:glycosyltransferase involved in cell wall biosynthesis